MMNKIDAPYRASLSHGIFEKEQHNTIVREPVL